MVPFFMFRLIIPQIGSVKSSRISSEVTENLEIYYVPMTMRGMIYCHNQIWRLEKAYIVVSKRQLRNVSIHCSYLIDASILRRISSRFWAGTSPLDSCTSNRQAKLGFNAFLHDWSVLKWHFPDQNQVLVIYVASFLPLLVDGQQTVFLV